jgi:hypothetical protein
VTGAQATIVGWNGRRTTSGAVVAVATFRGEHGLVAKEEDDVHRREKGKKATFIVPRNLYCM